MSDRSVRTLDHLEHSASTSRVLNLHAVRRYRSADPEYAEKPLFKNPALNSAIVVKHRLRPNEIDEFPTPRLNATKILIPIQNSDLRLGARYVFIGQRYFDRALHEAFGIDLSGDARDMKVLQILDDSPTLDPFVMREQMRRSGIEAGLCYFDLSAADSRRIFTFAQAEIEPLVRMSGGNARDSSARAMKLTRKILANSADAELDPLRKTMQMEPHAFQEGVFCWKAFLYYKWQLSDLLPKVGPVLKEIETVRPRGPQSDEVKQYLTSAREVLRKALLNACRRVKETLAVYDEAYRQLTAESNPLAFRQFLLKAPELFNELGERLGAVEHMISFWRFRFPQDRPSSIEPEELAELFQDFESGLGAANTDATSRYGGHGLDLDVA